jgi:hypothetical protein
MRNKVHIRRLTLALAVRQDDRRCSSDDVEFQWILNKEKMAIMVELAALSSSSTTSHHVHGWKTKLDSGFGQKQVIRG